MWSDEKGFDYKRYEEVLRKYAIDLSLTTEGDIIFSMKHTSKYMDDTTIIFIEFIDDKCFFSMAGYGFKYNKKYIKIIEDKIRSYNKTEAYLHTIKPSIAKIAIHLGYKLVDKNIFKKRLA